VLIHAAGVTQVNVDLKAAQEAQADAQAQMQTDSARYKFFAELKSYMLDLISCLDEKVRDRERERENVVVM
jgi:hypothetical protein